jgi:type IV secretory pathway VirB10-like protein
MSPEANVAQLQDLLARVQRNRLRLAELRTRAAEAPAEEPAPMVEAVVAPAAVAPAVAPVLPAPSEPAAQEIERPLPKPVPAAKPATPAFELQPVEPEPEPELEPLPDEPQIAPSEPFEEVASTRPIPLVAEAPARQLDLSPRSFQGTVAAAGPIAELIGEREIQRSWSLDAVLFRAWRLGRNGGTR